MSTCPENDIHSIYLDGEMPEIYKAEYEKHLNSCEKCKAKLEQMKKTHEAFQFDSKSIELDREFLDASFERLQSRLRYSKVVSENKQTESTVMFPAPKKFLPFAIAAAAVVAFVLPVGLRSRDTASVDNASFAQVQPIKRTSDFTLDQSRIFNEVANVSYPLQLGADGNSNNEARYTISAFPGLTTVSTVGRRESKNVSQASNLLADDFFSPSFARENNSNDLQVYMPAYVDFSSLGE